jgi:bacteriocin-like protein
MSTKKKAPAAKAKTDPKKDAKKQKKEAEKPLTDDELSTVSGGASYPSYWHRY